MSIRTKYTLIFTLTLVAAIGLIVLVNQLFLQRFYYRSLEQVMRDVYKGLNTVLVDDDTELSALNSDLSELSERYNMSILVMRSESDMLIVGNELSDNFLVNRLYAYMFGGTGDIREGGNGRNAAITGELIERNEDYAIFKSYDDLSGRSYLEAWGYLNSNCAFLLRTPVESIQRSASISNRFILIVGVFTIVLGAVVIYLMTRSITRPVLDLTELSVKMSRLDFSAHYEGGYNDELGQLGESMNTMSDELEKTINDLQGTNEELKKSLEYRERMDDMRNDFISSVSHDLKTPIALIQGYAEGLKDGMAEDPESRDYYCGVIMDEAGRVNQMVRKLLTLNEIEYGSEKPSLSVFDISELLKDMAASYEGKAASEGITVDVSASPCLVSADEFMIEEVVNNYLSNAFHYVKEGPDGRRIRIYTEGGEDESCGTVRVCVFNTGEGIPEEDIDQIWDKFYRADKARSREYGGNGIGLSIVRAIINGHGRSCGVTNTEDGPVFWFELEVSESS